MAYETSELYKEAIDSPSKITFIDGELKTKIGTVIQITNDVIDQGSFYITNQCVSSDSFSYGSVFAAESGLTLKINIDRYSLYDAELKFFFNILLSNNEYERIPLGKFYINEPERIGKNVTIKAYDGMINLEKEIEESTTGTAFELLSFISAKCNVELSQTEEDILKLANSNILLSVSIDRIATYRDLLSYIAQITCTFAIFDRNGKLKLCSYGTESVKRIEAKLRTSSKFSDFESYFSSAKAFFVFNGSYKGYIHDEGKDGLLYDAGEVPIVQGLDETNQEVLDEMYKRLSQVRYVPCDITFIGDPSLDLGDMITNIDRFGNEVVSLITFYKWSYRGGHQIKSAGSNPKLASVKEKKNKDIANLKAEISLKTVSVYSYTNAKKYSIKGGTTFSDSKEIIKIPFIVKEDVTSLFITTISFEFDCDGFVEFNMYVGSALHEGGTICQYCQKGKNIVTFMTYIPCKKGVMYIFSVKARTYYEETKIRVNEAKIKTNEEARNATIIAYESIVEALKTSSSVPITSLNDTISYNIIEVDKTIPTMTIDEFNIKAAIFGQGLSGAIEWDGNLDLTDTFGLIKLISTNAIEFSESVSNLTYIPIVDSVIDNISLIDLKNTSLIGFNESIIFNEVIENYIVNTDKSEYYQYDTQFVETDEKYKLKTLYKYNPVYDNNNIATITINSEKYKKIESVVIS